MQSLAVDKVDRDGVAVGGSYTSAEVLAALTTHRYEVFRYENHRIESGGWQLIGDVTKKINACTIKFDRWAHGSMRSADMEIVDDEGAINFLSDAIRCFHLLRMPDGNFAQWCMGTFYVPSPTFPLAALRKREVHAPDALRNLVDAKLPTPFQMPATASMATFYGGYGGDLADPIQWAIALIEFFYPLAGVFIDADPDSSLWPESQLTTWREGTALIDVINSLLYFAGHDVLRADINGSYVAAPWVSALDLALDISYIAGDPATYDTSIIVRESGVMTQDLEDAPNRWVGVVSGFGQDPLVADSKRQESDPGNLLPTGWDDLAVSYVTRGVEVTELFYSTAETQAKLEAQVRRKVEEGARVGRSIDVETPLMPHDYRDKVSLLWPTQPWGDAANGIFILRGWEFPMLAGGRMKHHYDLMPLSVGS